MEQSGNYSALDVIRKFVDKDFATFSIVFVKFITPNSESISFERVYEVTDRSKVLFGLFRDGVCLGYIYGSRDNSRITNEILEKVPKGFQIVLVLTMAHHEETGKEIVKIVDQDMILKKIELLGPANVINCLKANVDATVQIAIFDNFNAKDYTGSPFYKNYLTLRDYLERNNYNYPTEFNATPIFRLLVDIVKSKDAIPEEIKSLFENLNGWQWEYSRLTTEGSKFIQLTSEIINDKQLISSMRAEKQRTFIHFYDKFRANELSPYLSALARAVFKVSE